MPTTPRSPRASTIVISAVGLALVTGLTTSCLPTNDALDEKVVDWPTVPAPHIAHLRGRVVDFTTGQPIAGAKVDIGAASTISGPDGSYALGDLRIEAGDLETTKVGYDTARTRLALPRGDSQFTVRMRTATLAAVLGTP